MKTAVIEKGYTIWARETMKSEIFYKKPCSWFKIWFYLVSEASHADDKRYKRGACFVEYPEVSKATGVTIDVVKKSVAWMREAGMVSTKRSTRGVNIFITNYSHYQNPENYKYNIEAPDEALDWHEADTKAAPDKHPDIQQWNNDNKEKMKDSFRPSGEANLRSIDSGETNGEYEDYDEDDEDGENEEYIPSDDEVDEVIQFFNNVVPDDFVDDKNTHNREQTREAVRTLLKLHDRDQIGDRIEAFEHWKTESDRPQVKTVLEFCTDKLALVEGYIAEKGYVLRYG